MSAPKTKRRRRAPQKARFVVTIDDRCVSFSTPDRTDFTKSLGPPDQISGHVMTGLESFLTDHGASETDKQKIRGAITIVVVDKRT